MVDFKKYSTVPHPQGECRHGIITSIHELFWSNEPSIRAEQLSKFNLAPSSRGVRASLHSVSIREQLLRGANSDARGSNTDKLTGPIYPNAMAARWLLDAT